jgi:hypothetical protein
MIGSFVLAPRWRKTIKAKAQADDTERGYRLCRKQLGAMPSGLIAFGLP